MNRRWIMYLIALPLYGGVGGGLLSCRSARKIETSTTENVDVSVCSKDSMVRCVDFQFDKLEYWLDYVCAGGDADSTGTADRVKQKHVVITKGSVKEQTSKESVTDSIAHQSTHQQSVSTISSPRGGREGAFSFWEGMGVGSRTFYYLLAIALIIALLIIIRIRLPTW